MTSSLGNCSPSTISSTCTPVRSHWLLFTFRTWRTLLMTSVNRSWPV
uniref:Replication protein A 30 kDa subunit, putative n=1 Tax=Arundo donax TaxID=35708 RepID=A0A0A8ZQG8_ARUDO